ncbi:uncharacterized protein LOC107470531 [Arachis duranensis]|uniref:Uncharacterized protein LOC107470531 n=1 Tax=Arachis duranensis TaxID=130453 RepID=A0A6P4C9Q3_ARADU|nr:uncharacterized protein LOC107470531 [Arachis duranensis]
MPRPNAQTQDDVLDKNLHPTTKNTQRPDITSDQPNVPTNSPKVTFEEPPRIIQPPNAPTEPNLPAYQPSSIPSPPLEKTPPHPQPSHVPVVSEETGHQNPVSAEVTPTVDKGPEESNEVFTQYIPQPCNEPDSQEHSIQNEKKTPCERGQSSS